MILRCPQMKLCGGPGWLELYSVLYERETGLTSRAYFLLCVTGFTTNLTMRIKITARAMGRMATKDCRDNIAAGKESDK
jgi:hypothetical protein